MAIYVMSDIHGCFDEFIALLEKVNFNPQNDQLYLVGDLINRGPKSLEVMKFLLKHEDSIFPVLGNHDLSYLVYAEGSTRLRRGDTYDDILQSKKANEIKDYLRRQPLVRYIPETDVAIAHAGIPPFWSIDEAISLSAEVEKKLQTHKPHKYQKLMDTMFGNTPAAWDPELKGMDRKRVIINYLSRMRYLHNDLSLDFDNKTEEYDTAIMKPWFQFERPLHKKTQIIYGHWASLGIHQENGTYCIDSGCVWDGALTIIRIDCTPFEITSFAFPAQ